ncbi:phosphotransferase [Leptospira levettii]|uniref:phosphotransferase n=1 Tax=Leptospira levettii TaxID=2023178 RepID=UPI0010829165|nr:phosphotransferase [Leptospira levettii]TGK92557.1 phosphotransferase [Leptospira levettii]
MKKIDLHIHTIPTISDSHFIFSIDTFKNYVREAKLDAVAITNHDIFDITQYKIIQSELPIVVFPGIEINVDKGHLLLITNPERVDSFDSRTSKVSQRITKIGDNISYEELVEIFGNLDEYLIIPHYEKSPAITGNTLEKLTRFVTVGEVDSPKKFIRSIKDTEKLTPVLFSDSRMKENLINFPTRQTFVDCGNLSIEALKSSLGDKAKVALSADEGNKLFQLFEDGQKLSTGLNVLLGARSSGKTHTLNKINESEENVKYIKQFALVQQSEEQEFKGTLEKKRSVFTENYLSGLKRVIDQIINIDIEANEQLVDNYVTTLLKAAEDFNRSDVFSKVKLFDEIEFTIGNLQSLKSLIESIRQVIENKEYHNIVTKHLEINSLIALIMELISLLRAKHLEIEKKKVVNSLIRDIKSGLRIRTSAVQVEDVDLYRISLDYKAVKKFEKIVEFLKIDSTILKETIQGFTIEAQKRKFAGAGEIKSVSGLKTAFSAVYQLYDQPYQYLRELLKNDYIPRSDLYKFFVKIDYKILNRDGFEVSGGERSEFRLLQEINDSQNYDILLIDEPESSFDNIFLRSDVNQILKDISKSMPVVIVTHNSTVGGSVGADYVLYTKKEIIGGKITYRIYSGYPTDKKLHSIDGSEINNYEVIMNSLEAGISAYEKRRISYEATKN